MSANGSRPEGGGRSLAGASVLLAGASGGLGRALAVELAARGSRLTMVARHDDRLERVPVEGEREALDLRTPDGCRRAVERAVQAHGQLHVVVNAVGVVAFGPVAELSTDTLEELFLTNTFLPIWLAQAALPHLAEGGALVNISGVIAETAMANMAAYGASKAAVRSFDAALASELRRRRIRVLDARPPHTETGLVDRAIEGATPRLPTGLEPEVVALTICDALEDGRADLPTGSFSH
jgi:cyclic-di-GMP-binding biofilm dispersal mediator protein